MIIVDGYNFLYAAFGIEHRLPIKDMEAARIRLQGYLARYQNITHERVMVIYDARGGAQLPNEDYAGLEVVYAPPRSDADDHIVRRVKADPRPAEITVVTTDRELAERVEAAGGRVVRSGVFYERMRGAFERGLHSPEDKSYEKPARPDPEEVDYFLREFGDGT